MLFCAIFAFLQYCAAEIAIVANPNPFASVQQAAFAEHRVNWRDADLSDDDACTHCFAAVELQRYLRRISRRHTDFVLLNSRDDWVGDALELNREHDPTLDPEGYRISTVVSQGRSRARIVQVTGGSRVGVLYGAYAFLRHLGVRWYAPGKVNEEIPYAALERLPVVNLLEAPTFRTRGFWAWEDRGNTEFFDWMARNQMNLWTDAERNHAALRKRGIKLTCGGHLHQDRFLSPRTEYPYNYPLFDGDEAKPEDPYAPSPEFAGDTNGDGKLTYFEAHPEWYGLRNGKRSANIHGDSGDNFCTSNRDALAEFTRRIVQDLINGEWRDADTINFWMLDGGKWCECEECKAVGTPTDRLLLVVHALRNEIAAARREGRLQRDVLVIFPIYAETISAPTRPLPDDFDYEGCVGTFFPIARCYVHTLDDPLCTEYNARYFKYYQDWTTDSGRHYRGSLFVGEYYNVSGYKCLPVCFKSTMQHDIPLYYRAGARHMHYMHCTTGNWGTRALTNYQLARMLWDPHLDVEALYRDYFRGRYGPAAAIMRRFYDSLERMLSNVTELKYGLARRLDANAEQLFPRKHMQYQPSAPPDNDGPDFAEMLDSAERARALLGQAQAMDLPPRIVTRLAEDEGPFRYAYNTLHFYDALLSAIEALRREDKETARNYYEAAARWQAMLEADTVSTSLSSSHASAPNAFVASFVTNAWRRLTEALQPQ